MCESSWPEPAAWSSGALAGVAALVVRICSNAVLETVRGDAAVPAHSAWLLEAWLSGFVSLIGLTGLVIAVRGCYRSVTMPVGVVSLFASCFAVAIDAALCFFCSLSRPLPVVFSPY